MFYVFVFATRIYILLLKNTIILKFVDFVFKYLIIIIR